MCARKERGWICLHVGLTSRRAIFCQTWLRRMGACDIEEYQHVPLVLTSHKGQRTRHKERNA